MKDQEYVMTFKGLLSTVLSDDATDIVLEKIRAYLYLTKNNAVVFEPGDSGGNFVALAPKERKKK